MKKTLFMLLTLVLALTLVFTAVSCEAGGNSVKQNDEEATATELVKDKKAATGDTLTEAALNEVATKNNAVVTEVEPIIKDLQALVEGTGTNVSSASIDIVIKPQDGKSSFSITTADDYTKAKDYVTSIIKQSGSTVDESKLVPGEYSLIQITLEFTTKTSTIKYKKAGSSELKTTNLSDVTDPLALDMMVISYYQQGSNSNFDMFFQSIDPLLAAAANTPKVTCTFEMTEKSGTKYTAVVSSSISASGRKIITIDEITLKKGTAELATLKCNASVKFSDDFSYTPANKDTKTEEKFTGSVDVNIDSIELNVANGKLVLSGKIAATLRTNKVTMYAALSEKIGSDTIFDIEAGLYEASDIPEDLDKVTFYKCVVLGKSYSSDSVMKALSAMLSQKS